MTFSESGEVNCFILDNGSERLNRRATGHWTKEGPYNRFVIDEIDFYSSCGAAKHRQRFDRNTTHENVACELITQDTFTQNSQQTPAKRLEIWREPGTQRHLHVKETLFDKKGFEIANKTGSTAYIQADLVMRIIGPVTNRIKIQDGILSSYQVNFEGINEPNPSEPLSAPELRPLSFCLLDPQGIKVLDAQTINPVDGNEELPAAVPMRFRIFDSNTISKESIVSVTRSTVNPRWLDFKIMLNLYKHHLQTQGLLKNPEPKRQRLQ